MILIFYKKNNLRRITTYLQEFGRNSRWGGKWGVKRNGKKFRYSIHKKNTKNMQKYTSEAKRFHGQSKHLGVIFSKGLTPYKIVHVALIHRSSKLNIVNEKNYLTIITDSSLYLIKRIQRTPKNSSR